MATRPGAARWLAVGVAVALAAGCGPTARRGPQSEGGPGGRSQPLALTPRQELAVGRRAYAEVMGQFAGRVLPADDPAVRRARRVTDRLIRAVEIEPLQREINLRLRGYRFEWETNVIRDEQVNAFCLPAGKMFLFTGILKVTGDSDDHLATVLSHEMAHALAHHASERIARDRDGGSVLGKLSYGRMQEREADHIGVFLMAFAGADPRQAPAFWERMRRATGGRTRLPEWLSDHPSNESRIELLRRQAEAAAAAKKAFDAGRILPAERQARGGERR